MVEQCAAHPEAALAPFTRSLAVEVAAISQQLSALGHTLFDVAGDTCVRRAGHDGAHLGGEVGAVQHLQRLGAFQQLGHDLVGHIAHQHRHTDRHTTFTRRAVARTDQRVHHLVDVGIGHDHHVVLRAAQRLHTFAVARTSLVDVVGNGRGADEADGLHVRVFDQCVHCFLVALHHVEHALGQPGLLQQVGHKQAGARIGGAGFEDEGVARSNGHREHPHRHHDREVERRDTCHHTQRLAQRPVVDAGADLVGEVTLQQLRNAARKFDDVDAA